MMLNGEINHKVIWVSDHLLLCKIIKNFNVSTEQIFFKPPAHETQFEQYEHGKTKKPKGADVSEQRER